MTFLFYSRLSASCVHVSALLHALVHMFSTEGAPPETESDSEGVVPITSLACKRVMPRKQKERALKVSDAQFKRLLFSKPSKNVGSLIIFDPRPPEYRGTALQYLPTLLEQLKGKRLCVSLLFDPDTTATNIESFIPLPKEVMELKIVELRESLTLTEEDARKIEAETKAQRNSQEWFDARKFRITASLFGVVKRLKVESSPKNIIKKKLGMKQFTLKLLLYSGVLITRKMQCRNM